MWIKKKQIALLGGFLGVALSLTACTGMRGSIENYISGGKGFQEIKDITVSPWCCPTGSLQKGTQITIVGTRPFSFFSFPARDASGPSRLVVHLIGARVGKYDQVLSVQQGLVTRIVPVEVRGRNRMATLEIGLTQPVGHEIERDGNSLIITLLDEEILVSDQMSLEDRRPSGTQGSAPASSATDVRPYAISSGDVLQVSVYAGGEKQEEFTAEVSPQGTITSPSIGDLTIGGSSAFDVAALMTREYSKKIDATGGVGKPGAYDFQEGIATLNACVLSGGFTDYSVASRVKVTRR